MKTGKSADSNGICAEHFKYGADEIVPDIVNIINKIFKDLDIPEKLKSRVVTPVMQCSNQIKTNATLKITEALQWPTLYLPLWKVY